MYIVRHMVIRINKEKQTRHITFEDLETALGYISELRLDRETLLLLKRDERSYKERRSHHES